MKTFGHFLGLFYLVIFVAGDIFEGPDNDYDPLTPEIGLTKDAKEPKREKESVLELNRKQIKTQAASSEKVIEEKNPNRLTTNMTLTDSAVQLPPRPPPPPLPLPPPLPPTPLAPVIQETLALLKLGESQTTPTNETDLVIVIGNTGAGKSTVSLFLTGNNSHLEAFKASRLSINIRDLAKGRISKSTVVSKTIFPDLLIDLETNTHFYDCPGFSDTRNTTIEIANSFFMTRVAERAKRVKILIVINYSSVTFGVDRHDFRRTMKHTTEFLKNIDVFLPSIALVVTKVKEVAPAEDVVEAIAEFIADAREDMEKEEGMGSTLKLIDAILELKNDRYTRITFFRQPTIVGRLSENKVVQKQKAHMRNVIWNNTVFSPVTKSNFGFSVSPRASNDIRNLKDAISTEIFKCFTQITTKSKQYYSALWDQDPDFQQLSKSTLKLFKLAKTVKQLDTPSRKTLSTSSFLDQVIESFRECFPRDFDHLYVGLRQNGEYLEFLTEVDGSSKTFNSGHSKGNVEPSLALLDQAHATRWLAPVNDFMHWSQAQINSLNNRIILELSSTVNEALFKIATYYPQDPFSVTNPNVENSKDLEQFSNVLKCYYEMDLSLQLQSESGTSGHKSIGYVVELANCVDKGNFTILSKSQQSYLGNGAEFVEFYREAQQNHSIQGNDTSINSNATSSPSAPVTIDNDRVWLSELNSLMFKINVNITKLNEIALSRVVQGFEELSQQLLANFKVSLAISEESSLSQMQSSLENMYTLFAYVESLKNNPPPGGALQSFINGTVEHMLFGLEPTPTDLITDIQNKASYTDAIDKAETAYKKSKKSGAKMALLLKSLLDFQGATKNFLNSFNVQATTVVTEALKTFSTELQAYLDRHYDSCATDLSCEKFLIDLKELYANQGFITGYLYSPKAGNPNLFDLVTAFTSLQTNVLTDFKAPSGVLVSAHKYSKYLDVYYKLEGAPSSHIYTTQWFETMQSFKVNVVSKTSALGVSLHTRLKDALTSYSQQVSNCIFPAQTDLHSRGATEVIINLNALYLNSEFISNYPPGSFRGSSTLQFVQRITSFSIVHCEPLDGLVSSLTTQGKYLDTLQTIKPNFPLEIDLFVKPMQSLKGAADSYISSIYRDAYMGVQSHFENIGTNVAQSYRNQFSHNATVEQLESSLRNFFHFVHYYNRVHNNANKPKSIYGFVTDVKATLLMNTTGDVTLSKWLDEVKKASGYLDTLLNMKEQYSITYGNQQGIKIPQTTELIITNLLQPLKQSLETTRGHLQLFTRDAKSAIGRSLTQLYSQLKVHVDTQFDCYEPLTCDAFLRSLQALYLDTDFANSYKSVAVSRGSPIDVTMTVVTKFKGLKDLFPAFSPNTETMNALTKYSKYLDFLQKEDPTLTIEIDTVPWLEAMLGFKSHISSKLSGFRSTLVIGITKAVQTYSDEVYSNIFPDHLTQYLDQKKCEAIIVDLKVLFSNDDFSKGYPIDTFKDLPSATIIPRISNLRFSDFQVGSLTSLKIQKWCEYLDAIQKLGGLSASGNTAIIGWLKSMEQLKSRTMEKLKTTVTTSIYRNTVQAVSDLAQSMHVNSLATLSKVGDLQDKIRSVEQSLLTIGRIDKLSKSDPLRFLKDTIDEIFKAKLASESNLTAVRKSVLQIDFLETSGKLTTPTSEATSWLDSLKIYKNLVEIEKLGYKFLLDVFSDLSSHDIQLHSTNLKTWWAQKGQVAPTDVNESGLRKLQMELTVVPSMKYMILPNMVKFFSRDQNLKIELLNTVLKTALEHDGLSFSCSRDGVCLCDGKFVFLSRCVSDVTGKGTKKIIIRAIHTVFIDTSIKGSSINSVDNVDILIMAPKWWVKEGATIDLNGLPGQNGERLWKSSYSKHPGLPGHPGSNAGNFYGIGLDFTPKKPIVSANGGQGGNGENGDDGEDGTDGIVPTISYHFKAWPWWYLSIDICENVGLDSGRMRLKLKPNSCGSDECVEGIYKIYSKPERYPGRGQDGGAPGMGGRPGRVYFPLQSEPVTGRTAPGKGGEGGKGGKGGRKVGYIKLGIDEAFSAISSHCTCTHNEERTTDEYFPDGQRGTNGASGVPTEPKQQTFNPSSDFEGYIEQFKRNGAIKTNSNQFLKLVLDRFLNEIARLP